MLTKNALAAALPLTEVMDASKVFLQPKTGTVLEALVQATRLPLGGSPDYVPTVNDIEYMANVQDENTNICIHDVVMDESAAAGIQAVQGLLLHARTVVAPVVVDLAEKVTASLNDPMVDALKNMEVITVASPELLYNDNFVKEVMKYQEIPFDDPKLSMRLPTMATSDIREMMKLGAGQQDEMVAVWLAAKGDDFLITVWENIFQNKQNDINSVTSTTFNSFMLDKESGRDYALAVFLIARRLADEGAPENTDMSASQFEQAILSFRDQSAAAVAREIVRMETINKSGRVILRATENKVWVDTKVYDAWLKAGGSIEVLYGNILDGNNRFTVAELDESKTQLLTMWNNHARLTSITNEGKKFNRGINFLAAHFRASLLTLSEEEKAKTNADDIMRLFAAELRKVTLADFKCIYSLALRLVCRTRFYYSDAEVLLSNADTIAKNNPTVSDQEAMGMASLQYILNWVSEQFEVKLNTGVAA